MTVCSNSNVLCSMSALCKTCDVAADSSLSCMNTFFATPTLAISALIFLATINAIIATLSFDKLVKELHRNYPIKWEKLGSPCGFIWRPTMIRSFSRQDARQQLLWEISFGSPPDWVKSDSKLIRLCRLYRWSNILGLALVITSAFLF